MNWEATRDHPVAALAADVQPMAARRRALGAVFTVLVGVLALGAGRAEFRGRAGRADPSAWREASPTVVMVVWLVITLVFLFVWMIGLLTELQRSETIDLQKLMHLPVALGPDVCHQLSRLALLTQHLSSWSR